MKQYYLDNKEKLTAYMKQWRKDNPEKTKAYTKQYNIDHKTKLEEYQNAHKKERKVYIKQYCITNKEKIKKYYQDNKEEKKAYVRRYYEDNREECIKRNKQYMSTLVGKAIKAASKAKRKGLGFIPLNKYFEGYEGHHISENLVIYIPKVLHKAMGHCIWTWKNMEKINNLAIKYL